MNKEKNINLLIIGAGGLGIEITKLLSLHNEIIKKYKINKITIIDYDTIELTNLNRQFIFQQKDIGKYKSKVLTNYLSNKLNIKIESINKKIQLNNSFNIEFFKYYDVIINCLDNLESRKFIIRRIYLINKTIRKDNPILIIDGGTSGFQGQVRIFINNSCYDCLNIKRNNNFIPICTIKGKPETFEHCLVWAINKIKEIKEDIINKKKINLKEFIISNKLIKNNSNKFIKNISKEIIKSFKNQSLDLIFNNKKLEIKLIYFLSIKRSIKYKIKNTLKFIETENKIKQIIPSISTINSIISSLIMKNLINFFNSKQLINYFITGSKIIKSEPEIKNINCLFCLNKIVLFSTPYKFLIEKELINNNSYNKIQISKNEINEIKEFLNIKKFILLDFEDLNFSLEIGKNFNKNIFIDKNKIYLIEGEIKSFIFIIKEAEEINLQLF